MAPQAKSMSAPAERGEMPRTILPRSGLEASRLGFGLSHLHHVMVRSERFRLLEAAHELGITHFDTAPMYGDGIAERSLVRILRTRRSSVTVATKFGLLSTDWLATLGPVSYPVRATRGVLARRRLLSWPRRDYSVTTMRKSLEKSLRQMSTDHVDIFFVHDPPLSGWAISDELCDALVAQRSAGKTRFIGIAGAAAIPLSTGDHRDVFDVIQVPETGWDGTGRVPDVTFGVVSALHDLHLEEGQTRVQAGIARALARRPTGVVLVGTRRISHLDEIAAAAHGAAAT